MSKNETRETPTLVDQFLQEAFDSRQPLSLYLVNGFQLKGEIVAFDKESILFKHKDIHQLVMRSALAGMYPLAKSKGGANEWWRTYVPTEAVD